MKKMTSAAHSFPEFKEARKAFEGINATSKSSIEKSIKRHTAKHKALMGKSK